MVKPEVEAPSLSGLAVRQAVNLLVDRSAVQERIYGRPGRTSADFLNAPSKLRSGNMKWEYNVDKANAAARAGRVEAGR